MAPLHEVRFPNETQDYRNARNELLQSERELRQQLERVAQQRRTLPLGGKLKEDYVFEEKNGKRVKLSELFGDKSTLVVYNFMYGPESGRGAMEQPCPMCTSMLDGLDAQAKHVTQRVALAVVAKSPVDRIEAFARERRWTDLRLLSSGGNSYNADYQGERADGAQAPALNVFTRRDGGLYHTYAPELMFVPSEQGQDYRHVDAIWPLWSVLDMTPEGRGADWRPKLSYGRE